MGSISGSDEKTTLILHGTHAKMIGRAPSTQQEGRVCEADGCDTVLSVYNSKDFCWQHEVPVRYIVLGRRKRTAA